MYTVLTHLLEKIISRRQSLDYKPNNATCKIKTEVQFLSKQWQPIDPKKKCWNKLRTCVDRVICTVRKMN